MLSMKGTLLIITWLAVSVTGCTTKSAAKAAARAAYLEGQQKALGNLVEARRVNIRFIGPVRNPEVVWSNGLTLAQAIAAADYAETRDPNVIIIIRQRERVEVPAHDLLAGKDWPLEPGDTIEIHP